MIYTLTTNPAIDMNICANGVAPKKVNRTFGAVYTPNGKGLNVSFVLKHFGVESKILGFFGGFSGNYIVENSEKKQVNILPVWVDDTTRINIFVNDGNEEYKFVNEGSFVNEEKQKEMLDKMNGLNDLDYLSVSGSLAKGMKEEFYDQLMELCVQKKVKVILDISSPKLKELLSYRPYLIKPNDDEVKEVFGIDIHSENDVIEALKDIHEMGAQNILLTMGEKGAYFYNGTDLYYANAQPVKVLSSACAGDSALAAFMSVWLEQPDQIEYALKKAAATGANVAESNAIGNLKKVEQYQKNIYVKKII